MSKLWNDIIASITPLKQKTKGNIAIPTKIPTQKENSIEISFITPTDIKPIKRRFIKEKDLQISDTSRIDKTTAQKIKKEAKKPDSILDLHGYTLQSAYETFIKFITNNYYSHKRTLLVITGKGDPSKQTGTIRREFEKWINSEEIKQLILYVELAPYKTQNNGAFYIYLRK
jgi:DNA-nicking Smr family endonuclease